MVSFSCTVIGITPAMRPNGSRAVMLALGVPLPPRVDKKEKEGSAIHIMLPSQGQQMPIHENRVVLFFSEEEWEELEHKPTFGENYSVRSTKHGFEISLED